MLWLLADAETVRNWLAGVAIVVSCVTAVGLFILGAKARKSETMEARLHEASTKLIDERFRAMTHELNGHVNKFGMALELMTQRLTAGDQDLRGLGDRDQKIELAVAAKIDGLKDYIRDNAASKKDLERHEQGVERKFAEVERQLGEMTAQVAVLNDRMPGRPC